MTTPTYDEAIAAEVQRLRPYVTRAERSDEERREEERAREHRARLEQWRQEARAEAERYLARWSHDPILGDIARLHAPQRDDPIDYRCYGCDFDGYDPDYPSWPCSTAQLLIDRMETDTQ